MSAWLPRAWRAARGRRWWITLVSGLPLALLPAVATWRAGAAPAWTWPALLAGLLALAAVATLRARRLDEHWLQHRLDALPALEDSADLLFVANNPLTPLQQLQRERIARRIDERRPDLREPWPWRSALTLMLLGLAAICGLLFAPTTAHTPSTSSPMTPPAPSVPGAPALRNARLQATPPAYTGLKPAVLPALDARQPQGTRLRWTLQFDRAPHAVALRLSDGRTLALQREGSGWSVSMTLQRSLLYRLLVDGRDYDRTLHTLEALPDRPPEVRVIEPGDSLVQWDPARDSWALRFEASDDYAVARRAELQLTLAQGSGENVRFSEHRVVVTGSGPATRKRFGYRVQPQRLGMQPGDDLIAQLVVRDTRQPSPQQARSASVILRWPPPEQVLGEAMEASVKTTLPAYFRSQRQIIIDAEALLKKRAQLDHASFVQRSDAIGVDQRLLRLRYGQFLGEETEGTPTLPTADAHDDHTPPLPTADLPTADLPTADLPVADAPTTAHTTHDHPEPAGAAALDQHDHGPPASHDGGNTGFGNAQDVLGEFGHTHDHAEAATLLDPQTRATLKAALDQMWQAEGELRQGRPDRALPFAYKALGYIKQVQQAERIYLARVGPELPPIDQSRRLGGKRDGLARRGDALVAGSQGDTALPALWQALGDPARTPTPAELDAAGAWLAQHGDRIEGTLSVAAALETLRAEPHCRSCRTTLRTRLWPLLQHSTVQALPRRASDSSGQRYLDALSVDEPMRGRR